MKLGNRPIEKVLSVLKERILLECIPVLDMKLHELRGLINCRKLMTRVCDVEGEFKLFVWMF